MNYQRQYDLIVAKYQKLNLKRKDFPIGALEDHHIIPTCFGGEDTTENKVMFTSAAHFVAHRFLAKIHGGEMITTIWFMCHENTTSAKGVKVTSRLYQVLRTEAAKIKSEQMMGNTLRLGIKNTPEQNAAQSIRSKAHSNKPEVKAALSKRMMGVQNLLGYKYTDEQKENQSRGKRALGPGVLNTSGVKGISWSNERRKWCASIVVNRKTKSLGRYIVKNDAIIARWAAELEYNYPIIVMD